MLECIFNHIVSIRDDLVLKTLLFHSFHTCHRRKPGTSFQIQLRIRFLNDVVCQFFRVSSMDALTKLVCMNLEETLSHGVEERGKLTSRCNIVSPFWLHME